MATCKLGEIDKECGQQHTWALSKVWKGWPQKIKKRKREKESEIERE